MEFNFIRLHFLFLHSISLIMSFRETDGKGKTRSNQRNVDVKDERGYKP